MYAKKMDKMIISIFSHRTLHIRDHFPIPRPSTGRRITEKGDWGTGGRGTKKRNGENVLGRNNEGKNIDECWLLKRLARNNWG
jgi:hypothetical protein